MASTQMMATPSVHQAQVAALFSFLYVSKLVVGSPAKMADRASPVRSELHSS